MFRIKKFLGQHFLKDKNIANKIVNLIPDFTLPILEIGAGTGILTKILNEKAPENLFIIEIDTESVTFLKKEIPQLSDRIYNSDFLKTDLNKLFDDKFIVIGNFPYNISSQILFKLIEHRENVPFIVGMFQKEVAERIAAAPNSKQYGILSVWLQMFYKIKYCFTVNENVFIPPPKVKSGVITLERIERDLKGVDEKLLLKIIKTGFNQRRKTLRNSLSSLFEKSLSTHNLFDLRPEQLLLEDFILLAQFLENKF